MLLLRVDPRGRVLDRIAAEPEGLLPSLVPGSTLLPLAAENAASSLLDFLLSMRRRQAVWSWPLAASEGTGWSRFGLVALRGPLVGLVGVAGELGDLIAAARNLLAWADEALQPPPPVSARHELEALIERAALAERETADLPEPQRKLIELLAERGREIDHLHARIAELEARLRDR